MPFIRSFLTGAVCAGLLFSTSLSAREYSYSDAHLHFVDFFQESAGLESLIEAMDEANVEHAIAWQPVYRLPSNGMKTSPSGRVIMLATMAVPTGLAPPIC